MNIIDVKNVSKNFGEVKAVDNISFSVETAFLGPNGAGKTTTIKMLTTLLPPSKGSIILNNHNVILEPDATRHSFGIVFQDPSIDTELTAYENMEFHAVLYSMKSTLYKPRIQELLELVDLWDRKDSLTKEFSGGMKRRLEIARGLLHHPKVLFLDEPTLGLDPQTRNHIWSYIQNLNKKENLTVFFTTHYMEEADKVADTVCIIDHGKIIANGTPNELKQKTNSKTLEDAFLALTGKNIREDSGDNQMKITNRMWRR
ncbi:MAG: ATP-binding cassette domain-containing protein [Candidatus Zambryskibacteria bacterium]|nr:ATP-binding cassette domain-containing protein [Candidatus Zambryskibacteria bacterium]